MKLVVAFVSPLRFREHFTTQADDIQNEARELSRVRSYVFEQLAKKTGHPVEKVSCLSLLYGGIVSIVFGLSSQQLLSCDCHRLRRI